MTSVKDIHEMTNLALFGKMPEGPIEFINNSSKNIFCIWDNDYSMVSFLSGDSRSIDPTFWGHSTVIIDCDSQKVIKNRSGDDNDMIIQKFKNTMNVFKLVND